MRTESTRVSDGKFRIALDDSYFKFRHFAGLPKKCAKSGAIVQGAAVLGVTALKRTGNAHELRFDEVARRTHDRVSMPTHIHEGNMRRQIRIRQRSRFLDIAA